MIFVLALLFFGLCLSLIWLEDMRLFEIKLEVLPFALALIFLLGFYLNVPWQETALGLVIWIVPAAAYHIARPAKLGRGDIWLFGVAGAQFATQELFVGVVVFALASIGTAYGYARARSKPLRRAVYPAAMPAVIAMLAVLEWRLIGHVNASPAHSILAYALLLVPLAGILIGAIMTAPTLDEEGREI